MTWMTPLDCLTILAAEARCAGNANDLGLELLKLGLDLSLVDPVFRRRL